MNGARERNNNFLLDGVDNNDTSVPGGIVSVLGADPESTQEFRVITNNFNAEYGRNTGAIIDVVTKSGTNTFHGRCLRVRPLERFWRGARLVQSAPATARRTLISVTSSGFDRRPHSSRTRLSSSSTMKWTAFITTLTNTATVPTAAFKTGVFNFTYVDPSTLGTNTVPVDLTPTGGEQPAADLPAGSDHAEDFRAYIPIRRSPTATASPARCSIPVRRDQQLSDRRQDRPSLHRPRDCQRALRIRSRSPIPIRCMTIFFPGTLERRRKNRISARFVREPGFEPHAPPC